MTAFSILRILEKEIKLKLNFQISREKNRILFLKAVKREIYG